MNRRDFERASAKAAAAQTAAYEDRLARTISAPHLDDASTAGQWVKALNLVPRTAGGPDGGGNRVAAHPRCDGDKGGRLPTPDELQTQSAILEAASVCPMEDAWEAHAAIRHSMWEEDRSYAV